ncbi:MAG: hypothetical protein GY820_07970 [Gammaproteobacteria bacterium]|nr:hypothetical protein [Gammaproteobacteria bacterium]
MPKPVQVFTYLLMVFLFSYLLLSPQYVDGKLMGLNEDGKEYAIQHEIFELDVDGRTIRFVTNGRGRFAIPKPDKFPLNGIELTFFPEGTGNGSPETSIVVPFSDSVLGGTKIINVDGNYSISDELGGFANLLKKFFVNSAYADDHTPIYSHSGLLEEVQKEFKSEAPAVEIVGTSRLNELQLTKSQVSKVIANIEIKQGVVVNTDRNKLKTIADLVDLVKQQKDPEQWDQVVKSSWVKPKSVFGKNHVLPIDNSNLKIMSVKVLDDSAKFEIISDEGGKAQSIFKGSIYAGERINVESNTGTYSIQLEKVDKAGFDRLFSPNAAFFNVNKK